MRVARPARRYSPRSAWTGSMDVRESVDKAMKLIEPALTMALGLVLAFILWAVLAPVYDILGKLKIREREPTS